MVAYNAMKCWAKDVNESIDHRGKRLYHVSIGPLREVGKSLHKTASSLEYKFTQVVNASKYSSRSNVLSYLSIFNDF